MAKRKIIDIDESKCTGCGLCIPNCPEGAIQMIDGKARLVSDLFCDGLGACLGTCPEGAITIEEREAEPYCERKVMENIIRQGPNVIKAHLEHLREHGEHDYFREAVATLKDNNVENPLENEMSAPPHPSGSHAGCPGSMSMTFKPSEDGADESGSRPSSLTHWPIQLHLLSPTAQQYRQADVLLAADCTAFSLGDFHKDFLRGKTLAIACPKLDQNKEIYVQKIKAMIDESRINTLTVMIMEVPCCGGLLEVARQAAAEAGRKVPIKKVVIGLDGEVRDQAWV